MRKLLLHLLLLFYSVPVKALSLLLLPHPVCPIALHRRSVSSSLSARCHLLHIPKSKSGHRECVLSCKYTSYNRKCICSASSLLPDESLLGFALSRVSVRRSFCGRRRRRRLLDRIRSEGSTERKRNRTSERESRNWVEADSSGALAV